MIKLSKAVKQAAQFQKKSPPQPKPRTKVNKTPSPPRQPVSSQPENTDITPERIWLSCKSYMKKVDNCVTLQEKFDIKKGRQYVRIIIKHAASILDDLYTITLFSAGTNQDSLSTHAVNVMVLAIILGKELGYSRGELEELGTAALFHEIGMNMVPEQIRKKQGKLTPAELASIKQHPEKAYKELLQYGQEYLGIAEVIQQEHERLDGTGYPFGLKGGQVNDDAYIIGLLDIYLALINSRPHRKGFSPSEAMQEIVKSSKGLFPTFIIKKILVTLSIYPIGSYIRLNNSSIGVVVKTNNLWPLKPIIEIMLDPHGNKIREGRKMVDLASSPLLYIKNVIPAEDVEGL